MCEILARLTAGGEFEVVMFGDKVGLATGPSTHSWFLLHQPHHMQQEAWCQLRVTCVHVLKSTLYVGPHYNLPHCAVVICIHCLCVSSLQVIFNEPVESWPLCDVLLSWHSEGFPLRKAKAYVELRRPFLINDGAPAVSDKAGEGFMLSVLYYPVSYYPCAILKVLCRFLVITASCE